MQDFKRAKKSWFLLQESDYYQYKLNSTKLRERKKLIMILWSYFVLRNNGKGTSFEV